MNLLATKVPVPRRFNVTGLDCQNEVCALEAAVGPVVGGEALLSFDPKAGSMDVSADSSASTDAIIAAVATTGMCARLASSPAESAPEQDACDTCAGKPGEAFFPPTPAGAIAFRIHGMDCADEVAVLTRELAPLVGADRLSFDLIQGRMIVAGAHDPDLIARIGAAVSRTGMNAELATDALSSDEAQAELRRRRTQSILTAASGVLAASGFAIHAMAAGDLVAAFGETPGIAAPPPLAAIIAYSGAVLCAFRYVAPKALLATRRLRPDMNLLMTIAIAGAIGIGQWFEAATVSFLFAVALALEAWSLGRARRAVAALMELAPSIATVKDASGQERELPAEEVGIGAHIVVRPGERIPLDGRVIDGESQVNQAPITGESMPVAVSEGAVVYAGTINGDGALEIETTKAAHDTTLARIVRMVGSAHSRRAPSEQWVEQFARVYTPIVLALAIAILLVPPLLFNGAWDAWFYRALVLLVIACPCALVISTPVSVVAALAGAAKQGVLIKGGVHLETPAKLKAIAMDKTGTLTQGRPQVIEIKTFSGRSVDTVLAHAAALEARSEHPLAKAIMAAAVERRLTVAPAIDVQAVRGKGVVGRVSEQAAWAGSMRYLQERGVSNGAEAMQAAAALESSGRTTIAVGDSTSAWGLIAIADAVRPEAVGIVRNLHASGVERVVMLTGDSKATAERVAAETGIDEVHAQLLPEQKVEAVAALVERYGAVAMIGDGVNDAPAMARANVGIAMGAVGSDAAIETADIALMQDDLSRLPWLIRHSRAALAIIRQNIAFSVAVKALFAILTVVGAASLWTAIAADVGASLLVVLNGLRLLSRDQTRVIAGRRE